MVGTDGTVFALGDCTASSYAPTAQVASQQGAYLGRLFSQLAKRDALAAAAASAVDEKEVEGLKKQLERTEKLRPFHYSHQGSLAYIGNEKAIADIVFLNQKVRLLPYSAIELFACGNGF